MMRYATSFLLTSLIYAGLVLGVYLLVNKTPEKTVSAAKAVPVTLAMFQPPQPEVQAVPEPPVEIKQPIEEPIPQEIVEPEPIPEPKPQPKPLPKKEVKPVPKKEPKKVEPKVTPKTEPKVEPKKGKKEPVLEPVKQLETKTVAAPPKPAVSEPVKPAKPTYSDQQIETAEQAYLNALATQLAQLAQDTYPNRAKRRRWEGTVTLSFTLFPNGRIADAVVLESSGRVILDEAALEIIVDKMNAHFKPFPKEVTRSHWPIQVPIRYELR